MFAERVATAESHGTHEHTVAKKALQLAIQDSSLFFPAVRRGPEPLQGNSHRVDGGYLLICATEDTGRLYSGQSCADNFVVRSFHFGQIAYIGSLTQAPLIGDLLRLLRFIIEGGLIQ